MITDVIKISPKQTLIILKEFFCRFNRSESQLEKLISNDFALSAKEINSRGRVVDHLLGCAVTFLPHVSSEKFESSGTWIGLCFPKELSG